MILIQKVFKEKVKHNKVRTFHHSKIKLIQEVLWLISRYHSFNLTEKHSIMSYPKEH
jgi:hypothetical protein